MFPLPRILALIAGTIILTALQTFGAVAANLPLPAAFQKCDQLLGASPKTVESVLGQPDEASNFGDPAQREQVISWIYKGAADDSLELVFSSVKGLAIVCDNVPTTLSLGAILPPYDPATVKLGYYGQLQSGTTAATLSAKTKNGNYLEASVTFSSNSPTLHHHSFDAEKAIYIDSDTANPDFEILSIKSAGARVLISPGIFPNPKSENMLLSSRWGNLLLRASDLFTMSPVIYVHHPDDRIRGTRYLPVTPKLLTLLQSP